MDPSRKFSNNIYLATPLDILRIKSGRRNIFKKKKNSHILDEEPLIDSLLIIDCLSPFAILQQKLRRYNRMPLVYSFKPLDVIEFYKEDYLFKKKKFDQLNMRVDFNDYSYVLYPPEVIDYFWKFNSQKRERFNNLPSCSYFERIEIGKKG